MSRVSLVRYEATKHSHPRREDPVGNPDAPLTPEGRRRLYERVFSAGRSALSPPKLAQPDKHGPGGVP